MNTYNEIDPNLLNQAQLLGQRRQPTQAEQEQIHRESLTVAQFTLATNSLSSLLENPCDMPHDTAFDLAQKIAVIILDKSKASEESDEFGKYPTKRKMRNQCAAQLIYASLRTKDVKLAETYVDVCFSQANELIKKAEEYAEKEVPSSSPIELFT